MRVRCTLPNAAEMISGVRFHKTPGGLVSEDLDAKTASRFLRIPGYQAEPDLAPRQTVAAPATPAPAPRKPKVPVVPAASLAGEPNSDPLI